MKTCGKCRIDKHEGEYHRSSKSRDGLQSYCRTCNTQARRVWYWQNSEYFCQYMAKYYKKNPRYRAQRRAAAKRYAEMNPEKVAAHEAVNRAVSRGHMDRPTRCDRCGAERKHIEGHHPDYNNQLDVIWLCVPCHRVVDGRTRQDSVYNDAMRKRSE